MTISECYTTLRVDSRSQWAEVKRSYHFLAKKYHPDLNPDKPGMAPRFRKISEAFKTLEIWHKRNLKKSTQRTINKQRSHVTNTQGEAEQNNPQVASPVGKSPTPLHIANKNHNSENSKRRFKRLGATLFEWEKKIFLLDIRKNIFLKKRLPSHSNIVRVKKGEESFQVRIPPGPWTSMFIRVPGKGNKSMFSKKRGDLLLNIHVPNSESIDPAPPVFRYKVRIPRKAIGSDKVWTLKSATGPIKFTLPKTAEHGQEFVLKANRNSTGPSSASHIMTLSLI